MAAVGQKEEGVSISCQTDITAAPPAPLPLQYPANLIYAQSMLAICMSQLQRVDLNIVQLRYYLREHEIRALAAVVLKSSAQAMSVPAPLGVPTTAGVAEAQATPTAPGSEAAAGDANAEVPAPEAAADAAQADAAAAPPRENLRLHRRRLATVVKIAFVMMLLEVRTGWYFAYFFLVFLYIGGLFDPFIEWFQRRPVRVTLEQQLSALRNQQRREEERSVSEQANPVAVPERTEGVDSRVAGVESQAAQPSSSASSSAAEDKKSGDAASSAAATASGVPQDASSSSAATGSAGDEGTQAESADGGGNAVEGGDSRAGEDAAPGAEQPAAPRPPYAHRFFYQLVVMFFMTLLPWWNPDPRYL